MSMIVSGATALAKRLLASVDGQSAFERASRGVYEEWVRELQAQVNALEKMLAEKGGSENVDEASFARAAIFFTPEAVGALTDARRRMLAAATAFVAIPGRPVEQKSRLIRALAMLEPSDVLYLRDLHDPVTAVTRSWVAMAYGSAVAITQEEEALGRAGCLGAQVQGRPQPSVLGRELLEFMASWIASEKRK